MINLRRVLLPVLLGLAANSAFAQNVLDDKALNPPPADPAQVDRNNPTFDVHDLNNMNPTQAGRPAAPNRSVAPEDNYDKLDMNRFSSPNQSNQEDSSRQRARPSNENQ